MNTMSPPEAHSPLLESCPPSLPARWYYDPEHHQLELDRVHAANWISIGRVDEFPPLVMKRVEVAGQNLIVIRDSTGAIGCFHNTCRHRGAELCAASEMRLKARLITCPYHEWAYGLDGRLVRVPYATPTPDFKLEDHGLLKVNVHVWSGFVFVCLSASPPDFEAQPDMGSRALANWPMDDLVVGETWTHEIACNWKVFWENYNECLHCPGIHPELCDMVPIYREGIMAANERPGWKPGMEAGTELKAGATTWTRSGRPCGKTFSGLTAAERARGQFFVTLWPTMYIVAHVDYVRAVTMRPLGSERMELKAQWLFPRETLGDPAFAIDDVTGFAKIVMIQDAEASEMNQRGLKSRAFKQGRLMPQEYDVHRFQQWVQKHVNEETHG